MLYFRWVKTKYDLFLIGSVRKIPKELDEHLTRFVESVESRGYKVFRPARDNPFEITDCIGTKICKNNGLGILSSRNIGVYYDSTSSGSLFDRGMSFMDYLLCGKPVIILNPEQVQKTPEKSFENVLLDLHQEGIKRIDPRLLEIIRTYGPFPLTTRSARS